VPARNVVQIVINAEDNASDILNNVVGGIQGIGEAALSIIGAGLAAASVAVTGFATSSLMAFSNFEEGVNEIFSILPSMTEDAMRSMESEIQSFMEQTGRSADEATSAIYEALSAGIPQDNIFEFMRIANMAAVGGVTDLTTAVDGLTSVVNAYGSDVIDVTRASDVMFEAVRLGKTDMEQLAGFLYQVVPVAASMGVAFEDVAAALAVMTAQGVPTQVATTQLRQALVELNDPATKAGELFQSLTGQVFQDFIAAGNTTADAMALMEAEATRLGIPISQLFNSIEAGQAALALTGSNMDFFTEATATMGNAAGSTERAFNQMNQGLGMAMSKLGARWESLLISMGRIFEPFVTPIVDAFSTIIAYIAAVVDTGEILNDWLGNVPSFLRPIVLAIGDLVLWFVEAAASFSEFIAAVQAGVDPLLAFQHFLYEVAGAEVAQTFEDIVYWVGEFMRVASEVLSPIVEWIAANVQISDVLIALGIAIASVVIPAIAGFFLAFAPLGLLIAGVALLRTAWEENWGGIQEKTQAVIDWVTNTGWPALLGFFDWLSTVWETTVLPGLTMMYDWFMTTGLPLIIEFFNNQFIIPLQTGIAWMATIWEIVSPALESFYNWFMTDGLAAIMEWIDTEALPLWNGFVSAVSMIWDNVSAAFQSFYNWFMTDGLAAIMEWIDTEITPRWELFVSIMSSLWETVSPAFESFKLGAEAMLQPILDLINGINSAITGFQGTNFDAMAPNLANGMANSGGSIASGNLFASGGMAVGRQFGGSVMAGVPTWVGEGGRELFVPSSNGEIVNNRDSELQTGGKAPVNINIYISRAVSDNDAREASYKIKRELQAAGIQVEG
jgi:TP901 family phage tail tape measure protein